MPNFVRQTGANAAHSPEKTRIVTLKSFFNSKLAVRTCFLFHVEQKAEFRSTQFAIEKSRKLVCDMTKNSIDALLMSLDNVLKHDKQVDSKVRDIETRVDVMEDKIGTYLVKLASQNLSEKDSNEVSKFLHIIGDVERISDHGVNIMKSAQELYDKGLTLSQVATEEFKCISEATKEVIDISYEAFKNSDVR